MTGIPSSSTNENARCSKKVVVLATSAGGLQALVRLFGDMTPDFASAIIVLQHMDQKHKSRLASILARNTKLIVKEAEEGDRLVDGHVFVAKPGAHLIVGKNGELSYSNADPVNFVRPSADVLFESVAESYEKNAIAVVMTGTCRDGAEGVKSIKKKGGIVIAQDKETSDYFGMPESAIATGAVDYVLALSEISPVLSALIHCKD